MKLMKPIYILILLLSFLIISCNSVDIAKTGTAEEIYNEAMRLYAEEDFLDAKKLYDIIKLQHPASKFAEYSQFFMAEINYKQNEYIIAAFNYNTLRRVYPTSKYAKIAMYKAAECYFKKSPDFDRDLEYIKKALSAFQEFQYVYATDSLYDQATIYIDKLRNTLAHREYFTADLYLKLSSPRSALIYFEEVLNEYADTDYFEPAYHGKIKTLKIIKRYDEALGLAGIYLRKFPDGEHRDEVKILKDEITKLKNQKDNASK